MFGRRSKLSKLKLELPEVQGREARHVTWGVVCYKHSYVSRLWPCLIFVFDSLQTISGICLNCVAILQRPPRRFSKRLNWQTMRMTWTLHLNINRWCSKRKNQAQCQSKGKDPYQIPRTRPFRTVLASRNTRLKRAQDTVTRR